MRSQCFDEFCCSLFVSFCVVVGGFPHEIQLLSVCLGARFREQCDGVRFGYQLMPFNHFLLTTNTNSY